MAQNFSKKVEDIKPHIQDSQRTTSMINHLFIFKKHPEKKKTNTDK